MPDQSTSYMGFKLKNPIIAGSSGLNKSVENLQSLEKHGAAAVVLKSLFEEQIMHKINKVYSDNNQVFAYTEADDYISNYTREKDVSDYLNLIEGSKKALSIPVIASINCISASEWIAFAKKMENAGADGLELNIFILPSDPKRDGLQNEQVYFDIVTAFELQGRAYIPPVDCHLAFLDQLLNM